MMASTSTSPSRSPDLAAAASIQSNPTDASRRRPLAMNERNKDAHQASGLKQTVSSSTSYSGSLVGQENGTPVSCVIRLNSMSLDSSSSRDKRKQGAASLSTSLSTSKKQRTTHTRKNDSSERYVKTNTSSSSDTNTDTATTLSKSKPNGHGFSLLRYVKLPSVEETEQRVEETEKRLKEVKLRKFVDESNRRYSEWQVKLQAAERVASSMTSLVNRQRHLMDVEEAKNAQDFLMHITSKKLISVHKIPTSKGELMGWTTEDIRALGAKIIDSGYLGARLFSSDHDSMQKEELVEEIRIVLNM